MRSIRLFLLSALALISVRAAAQAPAPVRFVSVEAGTEYESVSNGFDDTRGVYSRVVLSGAGGTWRAEGGAQERFGEGGVLYGLGHTHPFGRKWLASVYVGGSSAGAYHARFRAGVEAGRKWGAREQLVTTLGAWLYDARDVHRDAVFTAEAAYYAGAFIVQGGSRLTLSTPGDALGHYLHAAVTHGRPEARTVTLRAGFGREAYLLVAPFTAEVNFPSWEVGASWREPVGLGWGVTVRASAYRNPYYTRAGLGFGVFHRF